LLKVYEMKKIGLLSDTHSCIDIRIFKYFAEVDEITMDAVPELPSAYDTGEIDDLGDLNDLFNMNDSQPVQRLDPSRFAPSEDVEKPLAKPPVDMPLTERLRQQAQAKAKKTGNDDQNVGPVK
jgi:cell division transport system ATP-binding protein